jgi:hypothetical protein
VWHSVVGFRVAYQLKSRETTEILYFKKLELDFAIIHPCGLCSKSDYHH